MHPIRDSESRCLHSHYGDADAEMKGEVLKYESDDEEIV